jgi:hypothetical protein
MSSIADLLSALSDTSPDRRASAAKEIFQQGSGRAKKAVAPWFQDAELKSAFFLGADGFPEMTVGVAVRPERFEATRSAMGMPALADVPAEHEAREFALIFPGGVRLDILTTFGPKGAGAIARYLEKLGEGIQQVELLCRNVDRATSLLRERFVLTPLYPETRAGADRTRVNFFLLPAGEEGKLLIELVEPPARH